MALDSSVKKRQKNGKKTVKENYRVLLFIDNWKTE